MDCIDCEYLICQHDKWYYCRVIPPNYHFPNAPGHLLSVDNKPVGYSEYCNLDENNIDPAPPPPIWKATKARRIDDD